MRWTERGAHFLLQVRTKTLNEELRSTFEEVSCHEGGCLGVAPDKIEGHPELELLQDEDAVICCSKGSFRDGISRKQFLEAGFTRFTEI